MERRADIFVIIVEFKNQFQPSTPRLSPKTDENLEYLEDDDVVVEEDKITYNGKEPVVMDDCDNITHCEDLF